LEFVKTVLQEFFGGRRVEKARIIGLKDCKETSDR